MLLFVPVSLLGRKRVFTAKKNHKYGILIAARNEHLVIGQLIESIKRQDYPEELVDVYVIADNCTDSTAEVAEKAGATVTDKPVKAIINAYFEIPKSYTKKKVQAIINGEIKPAKPDVDNIIKSIFDGCNKIIFKDDVQIYAISATTNHLTVYIITQRICDSSKRNIKC